MSKKKPYCPCPPRQPKRLEVTQCKDVAEIIEALTYQENEESASHGYSSIIDGSTRKGMRTKPPKFKVKPFKPKYTRETCIPMVPSMRTRLRYIGHCGWEAPKISRDDKNHFASFDFESTSSGDEPNTGILRKKKKRGKYKKRVRYYDLLPGDILLPTPNPVIRHTSSDKCILNVLSPRTSGEVIPAQKATVKAGEWKPPLPAKSGHDLFKPHSGIMLHGGANFGANAANPPGPHHHQSEQRGKPCHKGGVCQRKTCTKKKCRKYAALRKRQLERKKKRFGSGSDIPYTTLGMADGKPRNRGTQKHMRDDDDICGLDEIPRPEHVTLPMGLKRGTLQTHSLTVLPCSKDRKPEIHYGILTGSFNMYDNRFGARSRGRQALTMSVMAYCLAFHYHPKQWTMKLLDSLVEAGDQWYLQCLDKVHDHSAVQGICEVLPFGKKHTLLLNGKKMQVLVGEPDIVGYTMSLDPTIYNLCRGLKAFFKDNRAGIMLSRILKLVVWKDKVCYYIFDPAGRDSRAYSNYSNGCAALMNVKDLSSVAEVILARSILEDQKFVLAPVKVLKMIDEKADEDIESDKELTQAEKAMMGYRILNENCAIVNANMHLGDRCFEEAQFRQAIPIAIVAMTYAKISPPNTWFTKTLDKILRLGNKLYMDCRHPKIMVDMTIDNIPNEITVGPYACEIIIYRERVKGQLFTTKECILNIKLGLEEFFSHEYNSGVLEFNNYNLAIWRQKDMFYLFDPYPRATDGTRTAKSGRACCWMMLNYDTMAEIFTRNWDYLPPTTQFYIHAFKVLKLKKREPKAQIVCTLSDEQLPGTKNIKRTVLHMSQAQGDGKEVYHDVLPDDTLPFNDKHHSGVHADEEKMGDIVSLVDSIQEDYLPPIPLRYKNRVDEPMEPKIINLDSPTVSVTQVVPPWPKPRDKTNEPPEPDPDPEPTPPPTPPPAMPPEGGAEEEEEVEEEEDEEGGNSKKAEEARRKAEEEEARRKAEELPPPLPPPPPSPQPEPEVPLAPIQVAEDEVQTLPAANVDRHILLTEDAQKRFKLRQMRKKMTPPLDETPVELTPSQELKKPHNFKTLPDRTQIVRGSVAITDANVADILPFAAIMAIVTSYKYTISTWTPGIVNFIVDSALKLYVNKQEKFQLAPVHIIPKIGIGTQAFQANIDVVGEGPTWQLEEVLSKKFFPKYDRGMMTTATYSCAFFKRNGLYYLYDASSCNAMGLRELNDRGRACFLRFRKLHDLCTRVQYNKDCKTEDQQVILSRIMVRRLLAEPRYKLPEDYDYRTGTSKGKKTRAMIDKSSKSDKRSSIDVEEEPSETAIGYQQIEGMYRIEGTTSLKDLKPTADVKACHFVCLIAMLMAAMHPIRTWDHFMIDVCIEKGLEIYEKATNLNVCEKRVIKNVIVDGRFININIKKIIVVNENPEKRLEQYLKAVLRRLRYVIIRFPQCSLVICQTEGYFHLFDPYPPPYEEPEKIEGVQQERRLEKKLDIEKNKKDIPEKRADPVATWTLYRSMEALVRRIRKVAHGTAIDSPEFYTFELTSVKTAPRHSALNYRLSPLFRPDNNPNLRYLRKRKIRPLVNEKMYWLNIETIPWSRMNSTNDLGIERNTPRALWKEWDIEFPGDLYSLWGSIHPMDHKFSQANRGKQYLATCVVAIVLTQTCHLSAWTSSFLDGIVEAGDKYHAKCAAKFAKSKNHEMNVEDLETKFDGMFPYSFTVKFDKVIFGFVYNIIPDRFNLCKALSYFFEKHTLGILTCPVKNLAFGRIKTSYFMYDCQSYGAPIFCPGQGATYMLKCESLNRLIYCMTITLNIRRHAQQFHLYSVLPNITEKLK